MRKTSHSAVYCACVINVLMSNTSENGGNTIGNLFRKNSQSHFKIYHRYAIKFFFPKNFQTPIFSWKLCCVGILILRGKMNRKKKSFTQHRIIKSSDFFSQRIFNLSHKFLTHPFFLGNYIRPVNLHPLFLFWVSL